MDGETRTLRLDPGEWVEVCVHRKNGTTEMLRIEATAKASAQPAAQAQPPTEPVQPAAQAQPPAEPAQPAEIASTELSVVGPSTIDQRTRWMLAVVVLAGLAFFWARACAR